MEHPVDVYVYWLNDGSTVLNMLTIKDTVVQKIRLKMQADQQHMHHHSLFKFFTFLTLCLLERGAYWRGVFIREGCLFQNSQK